MIIKFVLFASLLLYATLARAVDLTAVKASLENDIVDKILTQHALADSDCTKGIEVLVQAKNTVTQRQDKIQYYWLEHWLFSQLSKACPLSAKDNLMRDQWLRFNETKPVIAKAGLAWTANLESMYLAASGLYDEAISKSDESIKLVPAEPLFQIVKAENLALKGNYLLKKDGLASDAARDLLKQSIAIYTTVLKADVPKSMLRVIGLNLARLNESVGDKAGALPYYKEYTDAENRNGRAYFEYAKLLFASEDCSNAFTMAVKANGIKPGKDVANLMTKAKACEDAKAARAVASGSAATTAPVAAPAAGTEEKK